MIVEEITREFFSNEDTTQIDNQRGCGSAFPTCGRKITIPNGG
jgi:hypothetical protein